MSADPFTPAVKARSIVRIGIKPTPGSLSERTQKGDRPANRASRRYQGVQFRVKGKGKYYFTTSREQVISMFRAKGLLAE